jgi:Flp pilus assembly pilin Flp
LCWCQSEKGATTAEYALILTLVVIILISTLSALGAALNQKLRLIIDQINAAH